MPNLSTERLWGRLHPENALQRVGWNSLALRSILVYCRVPLVALYQQLGITFIISSLAIEVSELTYCTSWMPCFRSHG